MESSYPISRAKERCFKKWKRFDFIKNQKVDQGPKIENFIISNEKAKMKSFFFIKNQEKIPAVGCN